ncbi:hypothetical protein OS493_037912 [Desmophyllum pertusum]|uniref:Uncharacterized protein n=1 Tax=Desmophyllum pertusum TaxID=174260 RepID=A0A9W9YU91_9CNID|nr:hypothetical protein OS493_037912 [Desmophyllum pertusum]
MTLIHRPIPSRGYREERKDVSDKGFKISFKHRNCCNNQSDGVFIIRRRNGSFDARACLNFSRAAFTSKEENFVDNSRAKPTAKQRETTNQSETVRRDLMTYCLVVTCLLLEVLAGVVLFGLWKIYWRAREVENTAIPAGGYHETGGSSAEYRGLEGRQGDDHRVGVPVDQTNYQELVQANQGDKYQCLVADATLKERECQRDERDYGEPKSEGTLKAADVKPSRIQPYYSTVVPAPARLFHSLRSLGQSTESRGCNTLSSSSNKHGPCNTSPFGQSTNEPLEGSEVTTEKAPGALTRNNYDDPIEIEDPIHYVTEGLETGTSSLDGNSVEEPFYYELEEPLPAPNQTERQCIMLLRN